MFIVLCKYITKSKKYQKYIHQKKVKSKKNIKTIKEKKQKNSCKYMLRLYIYLYINYVL